MRVLIDYRAALSRPSGVGEYARRLVFALKEHGGIHVTLFSSSWKDRLSVPAELDGVSAVDRRVPVSVLNFAWHRLGWPVAEALTGQVFDVAHSLHPLLMPSRSAAQVITIHDLDFLDHPERTSAEIRRDYPMLARAHAERADHVMVPSQFTACAVTRRLGVEPQRITVCSPSAPGWTPRGAPPMNGYILFFGTLEPRKNVGALLNAYERLVTEFAREPRRALPELVLAGRATEASAECLERLRTPPLAGRVRHIGYVEDADRRALYEGARLLVQPSFEEGFGLAPLEAMTLGVPIVATNAGALPEVIGDAGLLVDTADEGALAAGMRTLLCDEAFAAACGQRGIARSTRFTPRAMGERALSAYAAAIGHRAAQVPLS